MYVINCHHPNFATFLAKSGTQFDLRDERYLTEPDIGIHDIGTEPDIGTSNIGLKGTDSDIMSDIGRNFLSISDIGHS
jgi:hypothetical protein